MPRPEPISGAHERLCGERPMPASLPYPRLRGAAIARPPVVAGLAHLFLNLPPVAAQ